MKFKFSQLEKRKEALLINIAKLEKVKEEKQSAVDILQEECDESAAVHAFETFEAEQQSEVDVLSFQKDDEMDQSKLELEMDLMDIRGNNNEEKRQTAHRGGRRRNR